MKSDPHFPIVIYFDFAKSSLSNKSIVHVSINNIERPMFYFLIYFSVPATATLLSLSGV